LIILKMDLREKKEELQKIAQEVEKCQQCSLYKRANRSVPGEGNPEARLMFIGEGPGYYEDQKGIPFCGAAGKLLDELLDSIKLDRKEVFIGNVIKHRPPDNRDPLPIEIEACRQWLDKQIKIIQPEIIVTLGRFSMAKFLPEAKISRIHGQPQTVEFQGRKVTIMPMYHPAAGLRRGEVLEDLRKDFLRLGELLKSPPQPEPSREQLSLV
jgi:uracil-DNA glycosylase family 4